MCYFYSMCNYCLTVSKWIHGLDEVEVEDTSELSIKVTEEHMNQKIKSEDIDRSHRLGNRKKSIKAKPQPIIVKFIIYNTRNKHIGIKKF